MTAGRKLEPGLRAVIDKIYRRDPVRYKRVIVWVKRCQKLGWKDEAIREAATMGDSFIDGAPNWFAYLTKLLPKAAGRTSETKSDEHKSADMALAVEFVEFLKQRHGRANKTAGRQTVDRPKGGPD